MGVRVSVRTYVYIYIYIKSESEDREKPFSARALARNQCPHLHLFTAHKRGAFFSLKLSRYPKSLSGYDL